MTSILDKPFVESLSGSNSLIVNAGNELAQITMEKFRASLNENDNEILNELAFYIDVNTVSALGASRVDVGGNMRIRQIWEDLTQAALMDSLGNYCELNSNDCRYTADGEAIVDLETNEILSKWAKCDIMMVRPQTYGRIQTVSVGSTNLLRLWLSPVPLPGSFVIPQLAVGKFKASVVNGAMRSLPYMIPDNTRTINAFWNQAQARSKNHGLANLDFRNYLLFHMMSKYGWRDSQNSKSSVDNTTVWGVGLDGTESTGDDKFAVQKNIRTGHTLSLGKNDGKAAVADSNGSTVHGVNVAGFENPWGQYWEMVQGLCSVGTNVYFWRSNFMPTGTPTASTFEKVEHVLLTRPTTQVWGMNIIENKDGQGCYMIPKENIAGISYGDYYSYDAAGQLWLFGGSSLNGAACGLATAPSGNAWSSSSSNISARLAFYGDVNKVSKSRLAELIA